MPSSSPGRGPTWTHSSRQMCRPERMLPRDPRQISAGRISWRNPPIGMMIGSGGPHRSVLRGRDSRAGGGFPGSASWSAGSGGGLGRGGESWGPTATHWPSCWISCGFCGSSAWSGFSAGCTPRPRPCPRPLPRRRRGILNRLVVRLSGIPPGCFVCNTRV